jgi:hypothetical protein
MSVCPIGLAIVLAACGAPEAQKPAPPKAPAAVLVVQQSERPSPAIENPHREMTAEEAKHNAKPGKAVSNLAPDHSASRSRSRGLAATRPCREMKSAPRGPDS